MLNFSNNRSSTFSSSASSVYQDQALRDYMIKVYNMMGIALAISGLVAFLVSSSPFLMSALFRTPLSWVVMFAPIIFVLFFGYKVNAISAQQAKTYLWIFAGLMGLSMSTIFVVYAGASIARVFFISASTFGLMALYGYTTKKDLTAMGSFLIMGLVGIMIASLVNIFLQSSAFHFAISALGVLIFIGLTAYDSQRIKYMYFQVSGDSESASKVAVLGALSLYMDFINLFMMMLSLFGERKN
ncbi:MAG: Bax inhibitor-1/YccA family protein [Rickettsiales bacterium]|nr:Bax inhibitor-1/YccA family protein [Rickettsiales bacterium]